MKEYIEPEIDVVLFNTEVICTGTSTEIGDEYDDL